MKFRVLFALIPFVFFISLMSVNIGAEPLDGDGVNAFDSLLMFDYSEGMDQASDFTQYASFLMPGAFLAVAPQSDFLEIGVMYAASSVFAFGTSTALKGVIERDRPYMYFVGAPQEEIDRGKSGESFPSRHSAMAFSGAAFVATLFALKYPDSKYFIPVTSASYALAVTTAALRIGSGSHFMTDVLAGAAIGTFSGFIVPYIALKTGLIDGADTDDASDSSILSGLSVSPYGVSYTIKY